LPNRTLSGPANGRCSASGLDLETQLSWLGYDARNLASLRKLPVREPVPTRRTGSAILTAETAGHRAGLRAAFRPGDTEQQLLRRLSPGNQAVFSDGYG
jgi:hypothetical protein